MSVDPVRETGRVPSAETLADRQAIVDVIMTYCRAIDRCDAALLRSCYHPDARDEHGVFSGSAEAFADWVMDVLARMRSTRHDIHNVLVRVEGDAAVAESYFVAHHRLEPAEGPRDWIAAGRYLDRFERRDGRWRIAHRRVVYDWSRDVAASDPWDGGDDHALERGRRGREDPVYALWGP